MDPSEIFVRDVGTWVDPMRRSLVVAEGSWDETTRVMTYWSEITAGAGWPEGCCQTSA